MDNATSKGSEAWTDFKLTLRHTKQRRRHTSVSTKSWDITHVISPIKMQYIFSHHTEILKKSLEKQNFHDMEASTRELKLSMTSPNFIEDIYVKVINFLINYLLDYDVIPIVLTEDKYEVQVNSQDELLDYCRKCNVELYWRPGQAVYLVGTKTDLPACYERLYNVIYGDEQQPHRSKNEDAQRSKHTKESPDSLDELRNQLQKNSQSEVSKVSHLAEKNNDLLTQLTSFKQELDLKNSSLESENKRLKSKVHELLRNQTQTNELTKERQQSVKLRDRIAALVTELESYKKKLKNQATQKPSEESSHEQQRQCPICLDDVTDAKTLKCGHTFCSDCINESFKNYKRRCPTCGDIQRIITGDQPSGNMTVQKSSKTSLEGFEKFGVITIRYEFPKGQQGADHPEPGRPYDGMSVSCYLPDNDKGNQVCELLKIAFDRKLVFTIGPEPDSLSENDVITWNKIDHKTRMDGGPKRGGFPDPNYLDKVLSDLQRLGITTDDLHAYSQ